MQMSQLPTGQLFIDPGKHLLTGVNRRYTTQNDVNMRLNKTILIFDGFPVFVKGLYDGTRIIVWDIQPDSEDFVIDANDSRLDLASPPLGFFRYGSHAFYATRRPVRSQRQGIEIERLVFYSISMGEWTNFGRDNDVLFGFRAMLMGDYPQLSVMLEGSWNSAAFSRTWALRRTGSKNHMLVFHRDKAVGFFDPQTGRFSFRPGEDTRLRRYSLAKVLAKQYGGNYVV